LQEVEPVKAHVKKNPQENFAIIFFGLLLPLDLGLCFIELESARLPEKNYDDQ